MPLTKRASAPFLEGGETRIIRHNPNLGVTKVLATKVRDLVDFAKLRVPRS
jgi:hypothetical protein